MKPQKLTPYCRSALWGGSLLKGYFPTDLPNLAEAWLLSVREGEHCLAEDGNPLKDRLDGGVFDKRGRFPLLIKALDSAMPLSVQVHPDDAYASKSEAEPSGKEEMWIILDASEDAFAYMGLVTTAEEFAAASRKGDPEGCLRRVDVRAGDIFFIPPGCVHALGGGVTLLEIQQNSDLTYRVWDYGRTDAEGNPRPLHTERACAVAREWSEEAILGARYAHTEGRAPRCRYLYDALDDGSTRLDCLADGRYFRVERARLEQGSVTLSARDTFASVTLTAGEGTLYFEDGTCRSVRPLDTYYLPPFSVVSLVGTLEAVVAVPVP